MDVRAAERLNTCEIGKHLGGIDQRFVDLEESREMAQRPKGLNLDSALEALRQRDLQKFIPYVEALMQERSLDEIVDEHGETLLMRAASAGWSATRAAPRATSCCWPGAAGSSCSNA